MRLIKGFVILSGITLLVCIAAVVISLFLSWSITGDSAVNPTAIIDLKSSPLFNLPFGQFLVYFGLPILILILFRTNIISFVITIPILPSGCSTIFFGNCLYPDLRFFHSISWGNGIWKPSQSFSSSNRLSAYHDCYLFLDMAAGLINALISWLKCRLFGYSDSLVVRNHPRFLNQI